MREGGGAKIARCKARKSISCIARSGSGPIIGCDETVRCQNDPMETNIPFIILSTSSPTLSRVILIISASWATNSLMTNRLLRCTDLNHGIFGSIFYIRNEIIPKPAGKPYATEHTKRIIEKSLSCRKRCPYNTIAKVFQTLHSGHSRLSNYQTSY